MGVFKRGGVYWYEFVRDGQRYRGSTEVGNKRDAEEIERALRTSLAKNDVGITRRKAIPNFKAAVADFLG
jgi:hypothetical protein